VNVTLQSTDLNRELELLAKVVANKPTIPVLANVLVQAEGNGLRLATTDLEIGLVTFCPATVELPGTTTLPVKHFLDIVKLLPGTMSLTLEKNAVTPSLTSAHLKGGKYKSRLQTYPATDYPAMPSMKDLPTVTVSSLQEAIHRVRFAVSDKNKRYFMDGALLTFTEQGFTLAATDGHRLAFTKVASETWEHDPIIIPTKTLDKIRELQGDTLIAIGAKHLFFVIDGRMLFSRTIDGKFPNYQSIVPRDTDRQVICKRQELQEALQRIVLTAIEVAFKLSTNSLTVTSRSAEIGDAVEQLEVGYEGPDVTVSLNGAYLLDFLSASTGVDLVLTWKGQGALLFTDGSDYCYVQMPLRNA